MLDLGIRWLDENPEKRDKIRGGGLKAETLDGEEISFYGLWGANSPEGDELSEYVLWAIDKDCSGAQHHAVMQTLQYIAVHGWDDYVNEMTGHEAKRGPEE